MAQQDVFDRGDFVEVYPLSTAEINTSYMQMVSSSENYIDKAEPDPEYAAVWPPSSDDWAVALPNPRPGQVAGNSSGKFWELFYQVDVPQVDGTTTYTVDGNLDDQALYVDGDRGFGSVQIQHWFRELRSENITADDYFNGINHLWFDLVGLPNESYSRIELVIGWSSFEQWDTNGRSLTARIVTSFDTGPGGEPYHWDSDYTESPPSPSTSVLAPLQISQVIDNVPYQDTVWPDFAGVSAHPVTDTSQFMPGGRVGFQFQLYPFFPAPTGRNLIQYAIRYDEYDDWVAAGMPGGDDEVFGRALVPHLRFWRGGAEPVSLSADIDLGFTIDARLRRTGGRQTRHYARLLRDANRGGN